MVMILCDGMGGMIDGGKCADIAVSEFLDSLVRNADRTLTDSLRQAALEANQAVFRAYRGRGGTTLSAALFTETESGAVSIGDTRIYEISRSKDIVQVSVDDTIAGEVRRFHGNDRPASDLEAFSNRLAQYIGMGDGLEPRTYLLRPGNNWYLICSDGVQAIPENTVQKVIFSADTVQAIANRLIHLSVWCGGEDNASAICFGLDPAKPIFAVEKNRASRLEIWDSFGSIEVLFLTLKPEAKAVATGVSTVTSGSNPRAGMLESERRMNEGKKSDSAKSKRAKRTDTKREDSKSKKTKPQKGAEQTGPPQQFEMEIIEDTQETTADGSEQPGRETKK
jgi:serine/threonine protein phosphatase PrpC